MIAYVDYVIGLDNLITTIPGKVFRNNIQAFAKMSPLFALPRAVFSEENQHCGTFLPEIRALIDAGASTFPRRHAMRRAVPARPSARRGGRKPTRARMPFQPQGDQGAWSLRSIVQMPISRGAASRSSSAAWKAAR